MKPAEILRTAVEPALALLPAKMSSAQATVLLLAICGQEADWRHRWQLVHAQRPDVRGPARGLWQFERAGGVRGVLRHVASREHARSVCKMRGVAPVDDLVWRALERDDVLAAAFARLLLWTDSAPLPTVGDVEGAWQLYLRTWRPGAYTRGTSAQREALRAKWTDYYAQALEATS